MIHSEEGSIVDRKKMFAIKEALLVLVSIVLHYSVEQMPNVTNPISKKYVSVAVEVSSFMNIRATNIGTQG